MATILKAAKWVSDGKTVVREGSDYPAKAGAYHKGGQDTYWIHKDGSPYFLSTEDILTDDWKVWNG